MRIPSNRGECYAMNINLLLVGAKVIIILLILYMFASLEMDTYKRGTDAEVYYEVSASPSDWWKYFKTDYTPGGDGWTEVMSAG